jgi:hypothetical protein
VVQKYEPQPQEIFLKRIMSLSIINYNFVISKIPQPYSQRCRAEPTLEWTIQARPDA